MPLHIVTHSEILHVTSRQKTPQEDAQTQIQEAAQENAA
jgi:hypothetical protein